MEAPICTMYILSVGLNLVSYIVVEKFWLQIGALLENRLFIDQKQWSNLRKVDIIDQKTIGQIYRPWSIILVDNIDRTDHWSIISTNASFGR